MKKNKPWPIEGFIGVLIAVIVIFLIIPLFSTSIYTHITLQGCFTLMILSVIYTVSYETWMRRLGILLSIPFIALNAISIINDSLLFMVIAYSFFCLFLLFAIFLLGRKVLRAPEIDTDLICGTLTIYLFAGILWAKFYFIDNSLFLHSFHGVNSVDFRTGNLSDGYKNQFDLLYYSFCTITTLGIGDLLPLHQLSRSLTIMEAMFGQLYVATVVAKTISVWRR